MAKYSDIKGFTVQTLSSDTAASQAEGGSWASGGSLSTARTSAQSSGSGNDNAILAGGYLATASPTSQSACESYNGTAWTEVSEMNTARQFGQGLGTNTAAIIVGGPPSTSAVESWNGSSWTEVNEVNTGRILGAALGTTTAGLYAGGGPPPGGMSNVESWNGSSWTETSYDLNTGKYYMWGTGLNTNAIVSGTPTTTEEFNGSSWTETTESSTNHRSGAAGGVKTDALVWGGDIGGPGYTGKTEVWNGSSWTELNDMTQPKSYTGGTENGPSSASALAFGGSTPTQVTATEEWSAPAVFSKITEGQLFFNSTTNAFKETITDLPGATWATGGSLNTARGNNPDSTGGAQTAAMLAGGGYPTSVALTELYNGTSWSEDSDLNTARSNAAVGGTSTLTVLALGNVAGPSPGNPTNTETWDGSSWTEVNDANTARTLVSGSGVYNSALATGGSGGLTNVESWNGTSWTEVSEINSGRYGGGAAGSSNTDSLFFGGSPEPAGVTKNEKWDGSSWTELGDMNQAKVYHAGCGVSTAALAFGGQSGPQIAKNEAWNGTAWTELADLASARNTLCGAGSTSAALAYGGGSPGNATEEFTASLSNKTITAS